MPKAKTVRRDKKLQKQLDSYAGDMPQSHKIAVINGRNLRKFVKQHENKD